MFNTFKINCGFNICMGPAITFCWIPFCFCILPLNWLEIRTVFNYSYSEISQTPHVKKMLSFIRTQKLRYSDLSNTVTFTLIQISRLWWIARFYIDFIFLDRFGVNGLNYLGETIRYVDNLSNNKPYGKNLFSKILNYEKQGFFI